MTHRWDQPVMRRGKPSVLAIAYACHPTDSAESRVGWSRALMASREYDVTVLCQSQLSAQQLGSLAREHGAPGSIQFVTVNHCRFGSLCCRNDLLQVLGYRLWHKQAARIAGQMHSKRPFDLVHQVNFCGYREPGYGWTLGAPFVWGPVGGTQNFPLRYLGGVNAWNAVRELGRNALNACQLRFSRRVRRAASASATILAATRVAQRDLKRGLGVDARVELEAGLDYAPHPPRAPRDPETPIRILWTGRLRAWKGLPLLLHALAQLPSHVRYEVRILGEGSDENRLRRMARRLGVLDKIEWVGWGPYPETLPHYDWADAFVFTSLRDTSGAGLLESLAAGTPIVGLNHQGAADIIDSTCGTPIELSSPRQTSRDISQAITEFFDNPALHHELSRGATEKAIAFVWDRRSGLLESVYQHALREGSEPKPQPAKAAQRTAAKLSESPLHTAVHEVAEQVG